jgi:hypothetical protein
MSAAHAASPAFTALIWWVVPGIALLGAMAYVVWVSKFQGKYDNQTSRSVSKFQQFQDSFRVGTIVINPEMEKESKPKDR